MMHFFSQASK